MAMGKRKQQRQEALFLAVDELPKSAGHPFYEKLNQLLAAADFDPWIEGRCAQYYNQEERRGQPSIPPGVYLRMLMIGYFEALDSQRGIAWRCADSLSLRQFLGIPLHENTPDHSTMSLTAVSNLKCNLPPLRDGAKRYREKHRWGVPRGEVLQTSPLGTESQRCRVILRWKSVIA